MHKAHVLQCSFHFFNTYGINRRAWYLLIIRLSFVSPNCPHYIKLLLEPQAFLSLLFAVLVENNYSVFVRLRSYEISGTHLYLFIQYSSVHVKFTTTFLFRLFLTITC